MGVGECMSIGRYRSSRLHYYLVALRVLVVVLIRSTPLGTAERPIMAELWIGKYYVIFLK